MRVGAEDTFSLLHFLPRGHSAAKFPARTLKVTTGTVTRTCRLRVDWHCVHLGWETVPKLTEEPNDENSTWVLSAVVLLAMTTVQAATTIGTFDGVINRHLR